MPARWRPCQEQPAPISPSGPTTIANAPYRTDNGAWEEIQPVR